MSDLAHLFPTAAIDTTFTLAEPNGSSDLPFSHVRWSARHHRLERLLLGQCDLATGRFRAAGDLTRPAAQWGGALRHRSFSAAVCVVAADYPGIYHSAPRSFVSATPYAGIQVGRR